MWKDIKGWEQYYEVCDNGMVKNKLTNHLLVGDVNSSGYYRVCLYNKNNTPKKQRFFRHRLVAEHFIYNPSNLLEVNHIDNNVANNGYDNLEWVTRIENEFQSHVTGNKKYTPFYIKCNNGEIKIYHIVAQLGRDLDVSKRLVLNWLQKKSDTYKKHGISEIEYF